MSFKPGDLVCLAKHGPPTSWGTIPWGYAAGGFIDQNQRDIAWDQPLLLIKEAPDGGSPEERRNNGYDWRTVVLVDDELVTVYSPYLIRYPANGFKENV